MDISVDKTPDVELHDDNVLHDLVEYSRSKQVLNEEQTIITMLTYITGLLPDHSDYAAAIITGGSSGGKTHLKQNVIDKLFALQKDWLFDVTAGSDKSMIDHPDWDGARIAALNELNKIPDEMAEFFKSVHGDDGGMNYSRNVSDPDSRTGRTSVDIKREAKPIVFMLADENKMEVEREVETRFFDVKVDETEEKNAAVHDMHWGHKNLTLPSADTEYIFDAPKLQYALQYHVANIPVDTPVLIPTGMGMFDGDDWDAANVTKPMFTFKRSESTRASRMIASLVKASALLNYHARSTVQMENEDGEMEEYIVAEPVDVGNAIACRRTLLTSTHGLDEKKQAILDAIIEHGSPMAQNDGALGATKKSIQQAIQDNPNIATFGKTEFKKHTEEMNEAYIIDIQDNPNDRRENIYVYEGGNALGRPNIEDEWDKFQDVEDPIRKQPIKDTIDEQQERLGATSASDAITGAQTPSEGQQAIDGTTVPNEPESLGEAAQELSGLQSDVHSLMYENLHGEKVCIEDLDDMDYEHLLYGETLPCVERTPDDCLAPTRPAGSADLDGTIFDATQARWDGYNRGEVKAKIEKAVALLNDMSLWHMEDEDDLSVRISVVPPA